ncbi:unnamed protein product [Cercospora beticola]|nr:unnamed protein product [Cercospora beticola]
MKFLASSAYFIYMFSVFLVSANACSPKTVNYPSDNACRAGCAAECQAVGCTDSTKVFCSTGPSISGADCVCGG